MVNKPRGAGMFEGVEKADCEPVGKVGGKEAEAGLYVELPTVDFLACRNSSKSILRFPPMPLTTAPPLFLASACLYVKSSGAEYFTRRDKTPGKCPSRRWVPARCTQPAP